MSNKNKVVAFLITFLFVSMIGIVYDVPTDELGLIQMAADEAIENSPPVEDDVWGDMQNEQMGILKLGIGLIGFFTFVFGIIEVIKALETLFYR